MKCPHCENELKYPDYAYNQAYNYHESSTVTTDCCGYAVRVVPRFAVQIGKVTGDSDTDDWGVRYKGCE